ncbi:MAG: cell wall hydrolase [Candidatus Binatia bacterium]
MPDLNDFSDEDLLTACLWAEARGETEEGQSAVCNVILNRVKKNMAPSIRAVILKPKQFSWTDPQDVNHRKVFTARTDSPQSWERAQNIAQMALAEALEDITKHADHYLNVEVTRKMRGGSLPKWAQEGIEKGKVTVVIGNHTFLNLRG